ncbi:hypothetical protein NDU88_006308 [Pleurodeles waltl]|uniref:Uncharacterized protein n=1 Tax=Pleurodeles waltl TaxID=8319 RepID=A0AAV7UNL2_PLEWA|nr:hypothetical protein NDU88_006308 [Pleurodeles waltl]
MDKSVLESAFSGSPLGHRAPFFRLALSHAVSLVSSDSEWLRHLRVPPSASVRAGLAGQGAGRVPLNNQESRSMVR